jgi:Uma2 family endonuclease
MNFALAEMPLPLRFRPDKPMTDDELMHFCAANELLRVERDASGEIHLKPLAGCQTSRRNIAIISALGRWAMRDGRGEALANAGFVLPDGSMFGAYAAWVLNERWKCLIDQDKDEFAPLCPDFVIELRSPSDNLADLEAKMELWIANGAQVAWLIDPERQVVVVYRPGDQPEVHHHPSSVQGSGVIAGFELVMERIWG